MVYNHEAYDKIFPRKKEKEKVESMVKTESEDTETESEDTETESEDTETD